MSGRVIACSAACLAALVIASAGALARDKQQHALQIPVLPQTPAQPQATSPPPATPQEPSEEQKLLASQCEALWKDSQRLITNHNYD